MFFFNLVQSFKKEFFIIAQKENEKFVYFLFKVEPKYPPFKLTKEEKEALKKLNPVQLIAKSETLKDLHLHHDDKALKLISDDNVIEGAFLYTEKIKANYSEGEGISIEEGKTQLAEIISEISTDSMALYFKRCQIQWGGYERWKRNGNAEGSTLRIYRCGAFCFCFNFSRKNQKT